MPQLIAKVTNNPVGSDIKLFEGVKTITISVDDINDTDDVLQKIEPFIISLGDCEKTTLSIQVFTMSGSYVINAMVQNGSLSGVKIS